MLAIPVMVEEVLPDDTFITRYESRITTDSLLSPALGAFKVSIHEFFCPARLYSYSLDRNVVNRANATWDNNLPLPRLVDPSYSYLLSRYPQSGGSYPTTEAFRAEVEEVNRTIESFSVQRSSLSDYLGMLPAGYINLSPVDRDLNGLPYLAYYDIIRNYFVHQQSNVARFVSWRVSSFPVGNGASVYEVPLSNLDYWVGDARNVDGYTLESNHNFVFSHQAGTFDGLACTTFMPDMFMNYLSSAMLDSIRQVGRVNVETDQATNQQYTTVETLRFANHLVRYLELSLLGGNSKLSDWLHANWGVTIDQGIVKPEYLGSTTQWVKFGEVISTSNALAQDGDSVTGLGDRGGVGFGRGAGRKRRFNFKEPGIYMAIMTIVPEVDYTQGVPKMATKHYMSDHFVPSLDGIGFQKAGYFELNALPQRSRSSLPISIDGSQPLSVYFTRYLEQNGSDIGSPNCDPFLTSYGEQPAWIEYMSAVNRSSGRLGYGGDLSYWSIQRDFFVEASYLGETDSARYTFSPYGTPFEFNYLFNNTDPYAQNFICEVKLDLVAKRQIGKNIRPSL